MSEPKPCSFCGKLDAVQYSSKNGAGCCDDCMNLSGLVKNWNTRPIEDALRTENEHLKGVIEEMEQSAKGDVNGYIKVSAELAELREANRWIDPKVEFPDYGYHEVIAKTNYAVVACFVKDPYYRWIVVNETGHEVSFFDMKLVKLYRPLEVPYGLIDHTPEPTDE